MSQTLVSICVITYNQIDFIHETLSSALSQDYANLEVVVADDGSCDGTAEVILEYAEKYPGRLVPLVGGPNLGVTGNSNRALMACRGKYIAFQGGDDVLLPGKISHQVKWMEEDTQRVICYHDMDVFDSATNKTLYLQSDKFVFRTGSADVVVKYGTFFGATTAMVRMPEGFNLAFDESIPVASDWLFWIEALHRQGGEIGFIDGVYSRYRKHTNNISTVSNHWLDDALKTLSIIDHKYPELVKSVRCSRSLFLSRKAIREFKNKKFISFLRFLLSAAIENKGNFIETFLSAGLRFSYLDSLYSKINTFRRS